MSGGRGVDDSGRVGFRGAGVVEHALPVGFVFVRGAVIGRIVDDVFGGFGGREGAAVVGQDVGDDADDAWDGGGSS